MQSKRGISPLYETQKDLDNERLFAEKIEQKFKCRLHKLPIYWGVDFLGTRQDELCVWLEVKQRNIESSRYPTVCCGRGKVLQGLRWSRHFANRRGETAPFCFAVRFTDGDRIAKVTTISGFEGSFLQARNHKEDPFDKEWVVYIPITEFKEF